MTKFSQNLKTKFLAVLLSFFAFFMMGFSTITAKQSSLTESRVNEFVILAQKNTVFKAKDIRQLFKKTFDEPLNKESKITKTQQACLKTVFSDNSFEQFNRKRIKTYLTLYPNRFEHDLNLLKSPITEPYIQGIRSLKDEENDDKLSAVLMYIQNSDNKSNLSFDLFQLTKEKLNQPIRDLLYIYNFNEIPSFQQQTREFAAIYFSYAVLECGISL